MQNETPLQNSLKRKREDSTQKREQKLQMKECEVKNSSSTASKRETDTSGSKIYYESFKPTDVKKYKAAFERDGFVVVDGILTDKEREACMDEVWMYLEKTGTLKKNDPSTWGEQSWPKEICRNGGFMGKFPYIRRMLSSNFTMLADHQQAWKNRQNPKIYEVFANLLETRKLWVSLDRYGIMRPTKIKKDGKLEEKGEWQTKKDWLHWDLNPFHYATSAAGFANNKEVTYEKLAETYGSRRVQGLVTVTDCEAEVGGFHCVRGFQGRRFHEWRKANMSTYGQEKGVSTRNFVEVPDNDPIRKEVMRVPMRAGSLLIWDSQLPHGNFPNTSDKFRMVHYIKMIPAEDPREFLPMLAPPTEEKFLKHFEKAKKQWFPEGFEPSPLGRKLLGLDKWTEK
mmetsp:Transcript_10898/g.16254  ORF Transcript_10898/g.16254 Transcript_10898/m.16254 type:complete len:397 (+) Transcript_10898:40-1230(+)